MGLCQRTSRQARRGDHTRQGYGTRTPPRKPTGILAPVDAMETEQATSQRQEFVVFTCQNPPCTAKLRAPAARLGNRVACPKCGKPVTIEPPPVVPAVPAAQPEQATIRFQCTSCGRMIRAPQRMSGVTARCPGCSIDLIVGRGSRAAESVRVPPATLAAPAGPAAAVCADRSGTQTALGADSCGRSRETRSEAQGGGRGGKT